MSLPKIVHQLVKVLGYDDAIIIVSRWGGTRVFVPYGMTDVSQSQLTQVLGVERVRAISQALGGGSLDIPLCAQLLLSQRNTEILDRHESGEPISDLALRFRMTERTIYRILREARDERNSGL